jgi:hypothetical protein
MAMCLICLQEESSSSLNCDIIYTKIFLVFFSTSRWRPWQYSIILSIRNQWDQTGTAYQIFQINKQNLQWPNFLQIIFFVTSQPATGECAPVSYFHFIMTRLHSSNYQRPCHRFSFRTQCCKPLIHPCPPAEVSGFPVCRHPDYRKFYRTFKHTLLHIQAFQFYSSIPTSCIFQCSITSAVDSTFKCSTIHSSTWIIRIM